MAFTARLRQPRRRPFRYRGVRKRSWGRWVAEIRVPKSRERLWLGSYGTPHQAARAYDVAAACLRGSTAARNLPFHAVPQPTGCLSPTSIRRFAAQEAARFTLHDDHHYIMPSDSNFKSSARGAMSLSSLSQLRDCSTTTVASPASPLASDRYNLLPPQATRGAKSPSSLSQLRDCSTTTVASPPPPLASDQYNLQQELPTLPPYWTICSSFPAPFSPIELDHVNLSSPLGSTELGCPNLEPAQNSNLQAAPLSVPRYTHLQEDSEEGLDHLPPPAAHHSLQNASPPSLLDLWFCLDLGPAVDPALKVLLYHSLYPDNGENQSQDDTFTASCTLPCSFQPITG